MCLVIVCVSKPAFVNPVTHSYGYSKFNVSDVTNAYSAPVGIVDRCTLKFGVSPSLLL